VKKEIKKKAERGLRFFLEALFPVFCVNCGKEGLYICEDCSLFLSENSLICPVCHESSYNGKRHGCCKKRYSMDGLASVWDHEGVVKKSIHHLKHSDVYHMAGELIERSLRVMIKDKERFFDFLEFVTEETTVITFVPAEKKDEKIKSLSVSRLSCVPSEGCHAEVLAKKLAEFLKKEEGVQSLLEKKKEIKRQEGFTEEEKTKNLKDAFKSKARKIPTNIVLVDDFFATGTTMKECTNVLKRGGAKKVWGFSLTRIV